MCVGLIQSLKVLRGRMRKEFCLRTVRNLPDFGGGAGSMGRLFAVQSWGLGFKLCAHLCPCCLDRRLLGFACCQPVQVQRLSQRTKTESMTEQDTDVLRSSVQRIYVWQTTYTRNTNMNRIHTSLESLPVRSPSTYLLLLLWSVACL